MTTDAPAEGSRAWLDDVLARGITSTDLLFCVPVIEPPSHFEGWEFWNVAEKLILVDHTPDLAWARLAAEHGWRHIPVGRNLGTGGAWNLGREILLTEFRPQDLLCLMSCYCVFPQTLAEVSYQFRRHASWKGIHAEGYAWHCIAFSGLLFREIGTFDENLPHYWGDNDWVYRGILAGHFLAGPDGFQDIPLDGSEPPPSGSALRSKKVEQFVFTDYAAYYRAKWGGDAGAEQFSTPFNLPVPTGWWSPRFRPTVAEDGTPGWLPFVEGAG